MSSHSYGHGQFCYYCECDGEDPIADAAPCNFSVRQPPSKEQMAEYDASRQISEDIGDIARDLEFGMADLDQVEQRIIKRIADERKRLIQLEKAKPLR